MITIREYVRPASLEEAWTLNQKRTSRVIGGMLWLKMQNAAVGTAIDLSGLGLDKLRKRRRALPSAPWSLCARSKRTRG